MIVLCERDAEMDRVYIFVFVFFIVGSILRTRAVIRVFRVFVERSFVYGIRFWRGIYIVV